MADRYVVQLHGIAVCDQRIHPDNITAEGSGSAWESDYSQDDPQPGSVVPNDPRGVCLPRVSAAQDTQFDLYCIKGGEPVIDGAGIAVKRTEEDQGDEDYRGWNEPNYMSAYKVVDWTTTETWDNADMVRIPSSGKMVLVAVDATTTTSISSWTKGAQTRTWVPNGEIDSSFDQVPPQCCCLIEPDIERVWAFGVRPGGGSEPWGVYYTDDAGSNWTTVENYDVPTAVTATTAAADDTRAIVDRHGNFILLMTDSASGDFWFLRSTDKGATWALVRSATAWGDHPSLVTMANGDVGIFYREVSTLDAKFISIEDAYDSDLKGKTGAALWSTNNINFVEGVCDDDGVLYAFMNDATNPDRMQVARSVDDGATWEIYNEPGLYTGATSPGVGNRRYYPRAAAMAGGEACVVCTTDCLVTTPSTNGSLIALSMGGWSNVESSAPATTHTRDYRHSFGYDGVNTADSSIYLPGETLDNQGWTAVGSTFSRVAGYHRLNPSASTCFYTLSLGVSILQNMNVYAEFLTGGGQLTSEDCCLRIRRADGSTYEYELSIRITSTGFRAYDVHGAASIGSDVSGEDFATEHHAIMVCFTSTSRFTIFHKDVDNGRWKKAQEGQLTDKGSAYAADDRIAFGSVASSSVDQRWGAVGWFGGTTERMRNDIVDGSYLDRLLWAKSLSSRPYGVRALGDSTTMCHLSVIGGAAVRGESWSAIPDYKYGVKHLQPWISPDPMRQWRSTQTATDESIVYDVGNDTLLGGHWHWAFVFVGQYCPRRIRISALEDGGSTFTQLGIFDGAESFTSVNYALDGDILTPAAGTIGTRKLIEGEKVGGYVILDPAGVPKPRKILRQSAGIWSNAATMEPVIQIELEGSEGTSGQCHIVSPGGVLWVPRAAGDPAYRYFKVDIIGGQDYPFSKFRLGNFYACRVYMPGKRFGRGWSMRWVPVTRTREDESGVLYVEKKGATYRELTWSYQDGENRYNHLEGASEPDYIAPGITRAPAAWKDDISQQLVEVLRASGAGSVPVCALPQIPSGNSAVSITRPDLFIPGVLQATLQKNNILGDYGSRELGRIESINIRELAWDRG